MITRDATGAATNRPTPHSSAPTMKVATATSHTSSALTKFDPTSEKLEVKPLIADSDRSITNGTVNWVKMPRTRPGMKQKAEAIEVRTSTISTARNTMPRLRGLKN